MVMLTDKFFHIKWKIKQLSFIPYIFQSFDDDDDDDWFYGHFVLMVG